MPTGAELRDARIAAGVSLAAVAAASSMSRSHLGNVETGTRRVTLAVVRAYQKALGDVMRRRDLLRGAGAVVAPLAVADLVRAGFAASLATEPRAVDAWQALTQDYGRAYMSTGAAELQSRLSLDLAELTGQVERSALWGVAARLMAVYGKTLPSNDDANGAVAWYRLAATAADRSGDLGVRVWVRGRAALALAYPEGAALPVADRLAAQALALSDRPTLGRLNALTAAAHIAAHRGDQAASLAAMGQARRVFDLAHSADADTSDFAVPEWRFHTFESMLLSRLGHRSAPAAHLAADRARPASLTRFATHIELHRSLYMVRSGDAVQGVAYARAALARLPTARHSLSLRLMAAEVESAGRAG